MTENPQHRTDELIVEDLTDGVMVYDLRTDEIHSFEGPLAAFWQAADGSRSLADLADHLAIDHATAGGFAAELAAADLLHVDTDAMTRRSFAKLAGAAAAGVASLGLITTIIAPTAAAAASVGGPGGGGSNCCKVACGGYNEGSGIADRGTFFDLTDANLPAGYDCLSDPSALCVALGVDENDPSTTTSPIPGLGDCLLLPTNQIVPCGGSFSTLC